MLITLGLLIGIRKAIEEHNLPEFYVVAGTLAENINELYSKVKNTPSGDTYGLNPIYTQEDLTIKKKKGT